MLTEKELRYAGLAKRLAAFLLDLALILGYVVVLLGIGIAVTVAVGPLDRVSPLFASSLAMDALAFLVLILPVILYFTLQESSPRQATWGKRRLRLRVVNANGERLTRRQAFVRSLLKFLPWQIAHTSIFHIEGWPLAPAEPAPIVWAGFVLAYALLGAYVLSALLSKKHRTFYDWAAASCVIVREQNNLPTVQRSDHE